MARALEEASDGASEPANTLLAQAQGDRLRDADGRINLPAVAALDAPLEKMSAALDGAAKQVDQLDPDKLIGPLGDVTRNVQDQLDALAATARGGATVTRLVPPMLGQDGPRQYLLVVQNNAEIRSTGGLPGSLQILKADNGKLTLAEQRSVDDFDVLTQPALPLTEEEQALYGDNLGENIRDTNLTPDFPRAAALMSALHTRSFGTDVDGVIAVDPVVLASVLKATGPVTVAGEKFTSAQRRPQAAQRRLPALPDPQAAGPLLRRGRPRHLRHPGHPQGRAAEGAARARQVGLAATVAGVERPPGGAARARRRGERGPAPARHRQRSPGRPLPQRRNGRQDRVLPRLHGQHPLGSAAPTRVPRPSRSAWCSARRPRGAASSFPSYITGGGRYVAKGSMRMNLRLYAPTGGEITKLTANGRPIRIVAREHDGRQVAIVTMFIKARQEVRLAAEIRTRAGQTRRPGAEVDARRPHQDERGDGHLQLLSKVAGMDFSPSPRAAELLELVGAFVRDEVEPVAADYHQQVSQGDGASPGAWSESPILGELRRKARDQGLWNLFLPAEHSEHYAKQFGTHGGAGLSNSRLRTAGRADGPGDVPGAVRLQLQRPRHGQHGGAAQVRHRRAEGASGSSPCSTGRSARRSR